MVQVTARKVMKWPYYKGSIRRKGEEFEVTDELTARKLQALGRVDIIPPGEYARKDMVATGNTIADARTEYKKVIGKRPFMGWDEATIRAKIASED